MELEEEFRCSCGRTHRALVKRVVTGAGVLRRVPEIADQLGGKKCFVLADERTHTAAGAAVCAALRDHGIPFTEYVLPGAEVKPDEHTVGAAVMHFDRTCDLVIGVGSGVVNDTGKLLSKTAGTPYVIVGTAPSMDGYASATSSMDMDGLKVSLPSRCADVVVGDTDVLRQAPERMLISGLGDMLAKYISICEWRLSHLITGEYYCETVAQMVRGALKKCTDHAEGLLRRDEAAVSAVFEGLVLGGVAMNYAGLSRPASGVEHYFSHVWDMRGLEFGTPVDLHGIQCAVGTHYAAKIYEQLCRITPNRSKALDYVRHFDYSAHAAQLRAFLGKGAEAMIALEQKEHKYDPAAHAARLEVILAHWDEIVDIIQTEIPPVQEIERILTAIHAPQTVEELGQPASVLPMTFRATKDIRDKYVASRLCWDLGVIDEIRL